MIQVTEEELRNIIKKEIRRALSELDEQFEGFQEQKSKGIHPNIGKDLKSQCGEHGYYGLPKLLKMMNAIQLASKGQYPPKPGK